MFEITCRYTAPYPTPHGDDYEQDRFFTSRYQKASRLFREAMSKGAFYRLFHPVHQRLQQRWINIAFAWLSFEPLPAVELIQIGNAYFVRDGHHRISVARAMGVKEIDAKVTAWEPEWIGPEISIIGAEILVAPQ